MSFGQDISGGRYVSTTKHPAFAMMLGVVASNGEKMPSVWFKGRYRLTGANYREIMATKVLPWIRKIVKDDDYRYVFQQDGAPAHTSKVVQDWMSSNMTFWPKDFGPHSRLILIRWTTACGRTLTAKPSKIATTTLRN